jgi:plastocyanin
MPAHALARWAAEVTVGSRVRARVGLGLGGGVLAAMALAACSPTGAGDAADAASVRVGMYDNFYDKDVVRVPAGVPVEFANLGQVPHNAVAADGSWSTETTFGHILMERGDRTEVVIDTPGVYPYYCTLHGTAEGEGMAAVLVVGEDTPYVPEAAAGTEVVDAFSGRTLRVGGPEPQFATIQAAVDAAEPGDLVLIAPGVYREEVKVTVPSLTVRGTDRNEVVIDGEFTRPNAVNVAGVDGVAVENLTVRNATLNGVFWTGVTGFRASYVTAVNNAIYGIYAFDSTDGVFEHSYASGSPDAGFYIGQCDPCNAIITDSVAEWNALGYSGTNASGNLHLVRSVWRHNIAGIVPNTLDSELLPPVERVDIVGNLIHDNGNRQAPTLSLEWPSFGNGVVLAGGNDIRVERNRIVNNAHHGVLVTPNIDVNFWGSSGNRVRDNVMAGNGRADLALSGPAGRGNCFAGNAGASSVPLGLQAFHGCDGGRLPLRMDLSSTLQSLGFVAQAQRGSLPDNPVEAAPQPGPQPQMPEGADAPVRPAVDVYASYDLDVGALAVPDLPSDVEVARAVQPLAFGTPVGRTNGWSLLYGLFGSLVPMALVATWAALVLIDIARREDLSTGATAGWVVASLAIPFVGPVVYFVAGGSALPRWARVAVTAGGLGTVLVVLVVGAVLGRVV